MPGAKHPQAPRDLAASSAILSKRLWFADHLASASTPAGPPTPAAVYGNLRDRPACLLFSARTSLFRCRLERRETCDPRALADCRLLFVTLDVRFARILRAPCRCGAGSRRAFSP